MSERPLMSAILSTLHTGPVELRFWNGSREYIPQPGWVRYVVLPRFSSVGVLSHSYFKPMPGSRRRVWEQKTEGQCHSPEVKP